MDFILSPYLNIFDQGLSSAFKVAELKQPGFRESIFSQLPHFKEAYSIIGINFRNFDSLIPG